MENRRLEVVKIEEEYSKMKVDTYLREIRVFEGNINLGTSYIHIQPTNNCQISSIGGIQNLLSKIEDTRSIFKTINDITGKRLVLIDINDGDSFKGKYRNKIEELFKEDRIVFKQPYINTSNHKMIMYLLNIYGL